jgi:hypothetical protein
MPDYTEHDITRGLTALVAFGGAAGPASRALKDTFDLRVPPDTLKRWKEHTHAERYATLQVEHAGQIEDAMVRELRDLVRASGQAERMAVEQTIESLERGGIRPSEVASIAVGMSKVKQSSIDKMLALTGRPQTITEHRSAAEILRALEAKGVLALES